MNLAALIAAYFASSDQPAKVVQSRVFLSEDILGDPCKALYRYGHGWACGKTGTSMRILQQNLYLQVKI